VTWLNRPDATLAGVEFEARTALDFISPRLKDLTLGANYTYIKSTSNLTTNELHNKQIFDPNASDTRPLYDQSPYILNLDLSYDHPTWGTSVTIGANITGERLILARSLGPDLYEHPIPTLDAAISQKFWKHWTLRFGVRNILDPEFRQTYGADYNGKIYQSYRRGRTFSVSLTAGF
jgi:outer membrane receptor protein involved in Fe transport